MRKESVRNSKEEGKEEGDETRRTNSVEEGIKKLDVWRKRNDQNGCQYEKTKPVD